MKNSACRFHHYIMNIKSIIEVANLLMLNTLVNKDETIKSKDLKSLSDYH